MSKSLGNGIEPQEVTAQARRRDHPPLVRRHRLLGRPRRSTTRSSPASSTPTGASATRCASCSPTPATSTPRTTPCRSPRCWRSTAGRWRARRSCRPRSSAASTGARRLRGGHYERLRVPPGRRQAAGVLLRRPGRVLPRRAEGPPLHHGAEVARAPLGADGAVAHHPRHAALDGALPQLHRRRGVEGVRTEGLAVDLHRDLPRRRRRPTTRCSPSGRASREVRGRVEPADRGAARRGQARLVAAGRGRRSRPAPKRLRRCWPRSATTCSFVLITSAAHARVGRRHRRCERVLRRRRRRATATKCERCWH